MKKRSPEKINKSSGSLKSIGKKQRPIVKQSESVNSGFPRGVGQPALRALASAGYTSLEQLAGVREADLMKLHGMGPKAMETLRAALRDNGLTFLSE